MLSSPASSPAILSLTRSDSTTATFLTPPDGLLPVHLREIFADVNCCDPFGQITDPDYAAYFIPAAAAVDEESAVRVPASPSSGGVAWPGHQLHNTIGRNTVVPPSSDPQAPSTATAATSSKTLVSSSSTDDAPTKQPQEGSVLGTVNTVC